MYCLFTACDRLQRPVARTLPERCSRRACRGRRLRLRSAAGRASADVIVAESDTLAGCRRGAIAVAGFNDGAEAAGAGIVAGATVTEGRDVISGAADGDDDDDDHDDDDQEGDANAKGAADSTSAETGLGGLLAFVR